MRSASSAGAADGALRLGVEVEAAGAGDDEGWSAAGAGAAAPVVGPAAAELAADVVPPV